VLLTGTSPDSTVCGSSTEHCIVAWYGLSRLKADDEMVSLEHALVKVAFTVEFGTISNWNDDKFTNLGILVPFVSFPATSQKNTVCHEISPRTHARTHTHTHTHSTHSTCPSPSLSHPMHQLQPKLTAYETPHINTEIAYHKIQVALCRALLPCNSTGWCGKGNAMKLHNMCISSITYVCFLFNG
jgi:hypothetical protein